MPLHTDRFASPVGEIALAVNDEGALVRVTFLEGPGDGEGREPPAGDPARCARARAQLEEYFRGERRAFDLDLAPSGTPFQLRVWSELRRIPYGETVSYGEIARRVGEPGASRAVGRANNRNPLPIVVPCHRVVGADADLVGFGGGLATKRALLDLERGQTSFAT